MVRRGAAIANHVAIALPRGDETAGPDGGSSALVARLALDGGVLSAALAAGESSGAALVAGDGTDVVLGGAIDVGPFRLGGEPLDAGARGMIMKFAP